LPRRSVYAACFIDTLRRYAAPFTRAADAMPLMPRGDAPLCATTLYAAAITPCRHDADRHYSMFIFRHYAFFFSPLRAAADSAAERCRYACRH